MDARVTWASGDRVTLNVPVQWQIVWAPLLLLPLLQHAAVIVATCNLQPAAAFSSLSGELEHRLCKFSCFP